MMRNRRAKRHTSAAISMVKSRGCAFPAGARPPDIGGRRDEGPENPREGPKEGAKNPGVAEADPAEEARLCRRGAEPDRERNTKPDRRGKQFSSPAHCHLPKQDPAMTRTG